MTQQEIVTKFVSDLTAAIREEVTHSVRKEFIAQLAGGTVGRNVGRPSPKHKASSSGPHREGYRNIDKPAVEPSLLLEALPAKMEDLTKKFGQKAIDIRFVLEHMRRRGLVRMEGVKRGATWIREEPVLQADGSLKVI